jgi:hypothetical protein
VGTPSGGKVATSRVSMEADQAAKVREREADFTRALEAASIAKPAAASTSGAVAKEAVPEWQSAVATMALSIKDLTETMKNSETTNKNDNKPKMGADTPQNLLDEIITLENYYVDSNVKTCKRKWAIFRMGLKNGSKAKDIVDLELRERDITPEKMELYSELLFKSLLELMLAILEKEVGLNQEMKAEIAMEKMIAVSMPASGGAKEAEALLSDYRRAYLAELRAGLVEFTPLAISRRLMEFRSKLSPTVTKWLKQKPIDQQPHSVEQMYEAIKQWAAAERAGTREKPVQERKWGKQFKKEQQFFG